LLTLRTKIVLEKRELRSIVEPEIKWQTKEGTA
jgi:hypothetical protein